MRAQSFHYNPLGGVHGGMIATLLDTAAGCSVHSTLDVGEGYTSLDLTTKFLRPVTLDSGLLTCVGQGHLPRTAYGARRGSAHRRDRPGARARHVDLHDLQLTSSAQERGVAGPPSRGLA